MSSKPERPLVQNPISHLILGAIHNPERLGEMFRDGMRETAEVLLEELATRIGPPRGEPIQKEVEENDDSNS